jgi:hypothetical protein
LLVKIGVTRNAKILIAPILLTIESTVSPAMLSAVADLMSILSIVSIPSPDILSVTRSERLCKSSQIALILSSVLMFALSFSARISFITFWLSCCISFLVEFIVVVFGADTISAINVFLVSYSFCFAYFIIVRAFWTYSLFATAKASMKSAIASAAWFTSSIRSCASVSLFPEWLTLLPLP